ncbi:putative sugar transport protein [Pseudomonas syringae pv. aceris]|uniref:MFS transporter n=2 Tax=Pseudomonas syringae TaxID=317 RepID=UPI0006BF34CE|nr:MFS transporter [Pseudomonas syringae]KOG03479.1 putative sugar transport protein [Pseudomonas syringae pv. aceris]
MLTAATLGWALDAFDMTIVFFLIPHLGKVFDASLTELAFVATMTGVAKVFGGIAFGKAADKYGRKLPFMVAVVWFCAFAGLSGLAWSYASFFFMRIMFGIGFGGEWATATALLTESLPKQIRSLGSGLMMAGYNVGSLLAGAAYAWLFPSLGWRWMFFIGAVPALLAIFVRKSIPESPEWLATKRLVM